MKSNITQGADEWDNTGALNIPESNHDSAIPAGAHISGDLPAIIGAGFRLAS